MSRMVARQLAGLGWTKATMKRCLWEHTHFSKAAILCVAGGHHPTHSYWMPAYAPNIAGRTIALPTAWETLIAEAEAALGPRG